MTDAPQEEAAKPESNARPPQEMRLRPTRAPVMRLSRRVLVGLGVVAAAGISVALFFTLQPQRRTTGAELYNTDNRSTPDGLANLPRNYGELPRSVPQLGPPLPVDLGRPILNAGALAPGMPMSASNAEEQRAARLALAKARSLAMNRVTIGVISLRAQSSLALFRAPGLQRKRRSLAVAAGARL